VIRDRHFFHMPEEMNDATTSKIHQKVAVNSEEALPFANRKILQIHLQ
jgi:hypothetical protein